MAYIKLLLITVFFLVNTNINANTLGKEMNPLTNNPYFTLKLNASGISYFVELNGASVHNELDSDGQLSTVFPVNHWMRSGGNTLTLQVMPDDEGVKFNSSSFVEIQLLVATNQDKEKTHSISTIKFDASNNDKEFIKDSSASGSYNEDLKLSSSGNIVIYDISETKLKEFDGALSFERKLEIPNSLPLWKFFESEELPNLESMSDNDYYSLMDTLLIEYGKVQSALKTGQINEIISLFEERNRELDAAFYYQPGTMKNKISTSLLDAAKNTELELVDLNKNNVDFTVESNNKLVSLTRDGLSSAITLNFKNGYGSQRYNLIFRKENNKWILTR